MSNLNEGANGSAWMLHNHFNQDLADSEEEERDAALVKEEARRRALNPWLGAKPHTIQEDLEDEDEELVEGTSGSAWMFYNHYNPELLQAVQQVIVGEKIEDVVGNLLSEVSRSDNDYGTPEWRARRIRRDTREMKGTALGALGGAAAGAGLASAAGGSPGMGALTGAVGGMYYGMYKGNQYHKKAESYKMLKQLALKKAKQRRAEKK